MTPPPRRPAPSFANEWAHQRRDASARVRRPAGEKPRPSAAQARAADSTGAAPGSAPDVKPDVAPGRTWPAWVTDLKESFGASELFIAFTIVAITSVVYLHSTDSKASNFDYFVRLADAFLHGRVYLNEGPSWLNELIPQNGHWYVPYPPMPAVVLMPFVWVFGTGFHQQIAACWFGSIAVGLMYLVLGHFDLTVRARWMLTAVFGFGTVLWYSSETGSAWLMSQSVAVMFATAALLPAIGPRKWPFVAGLLLGLATVSRLPVGLTAPFYLAMILELGWPPRIPVNRWAAFAASILFAIGLFLPEALNMLYNMVRWGTPIDQAYVLIPGVLQDPIYKEHGILSVFYIPRQLYAIFFRSWNFVEEAPFLKPSWYGLSLFLTTPLFLWLAKGRWTDRRVVYAWFAVALGMIPIITHGNVGLTQFGYRFSMDVQPLLFVILATVFERGVSRLAWTAAVIAILTQAYGVWTIGMGFVSF